MPDFRFGGREARERLALRYPVGTRIELQSLCNDEPNMPMGLRGTVTGHDDQPALLMRFDNGSSLSIFPDEDRFKVLTTEEISAEQEAPFSIGDIHTSPDFQCDQTSGYPTVLVWNQGNGTAILQPAPAFDDDSDQAKQCIRDCADWGVHPCSSWEDYNNLLESIGEEAYENAAVPLEEDQGMGDIT